MRRAPEAQQLFLALGSSAAADLVFRFAVETGEAGRVDRVAFLTLRGEDRVECCWPVPLPTAAAGTAEQLRLLKDGGYARPGQGRAMRSCPQPGFP